MLTERKRERKRERERLNRRPNRDNGPESARDRRNGKRPVPGRMKSCRVVDRSFAYTFASDRRESAAIVERQASRNVALATALSPLQNGSIAIIMDNCARLPARGPISRQRCEIVAAFQAARILRYFHFYSETLATPYPRLCNAPGLSFVLF
jgi:hypothetical protein